MSLKPIHCTGCGGAVPLLNQPRVICPYCGAGVVIPQDYLKAAQARAGESAARQAMEPLWEKLSRPVPRWLGTVGVLAVVFLPPALTLLAHLLTFPPWSTLEILAKVAIPALVPGATMWLWAAATGATTIAFQQTMAAAPAKDGRGPLCCRLCGAPLSIESEALSASCAYCGTDSVVQGLPVVRMQIKWKKAMRTLKEATEALKRRRVLLALGIFGGALFIGSSTALLWIGLASV
jgi:hypothetical protein